MQFKKPMVKWDVEDRVTGFRHRVVLFDDGVLVRTGDWTPYKGIATLEVAGRLFCAATDFHAGDGLPTSRIFEASINPTWNTLPMTEQ